MSNPYPHTHVLVDLERRFQTTNCRFFDLDVNVLGNSEAIHPNIKCVGTKGHWDNACTYLAKEDPENRDLLVKPNFITGILECATSQEALLKFAKKPGDVAGVLQAHKLRPAFGCLDRTCEFARWQVQLKGILEERGPICHPPTPLVDPDWTLPFVFKSGNDRKIIVIWDPIGKCGKTFFCKQLMVHDPRKYLMLQGISCVRDTATVIAGALQNGWLGDTVLINLTRSSADHKIYDPIEALRDGCITSQKYEGRTMLWDSANLVMLSNWMPKLSSMSKDRWEVYSIEKHLKTLVPMSFTEACDVYTNEVDARHKANAVHIDWGDGSGCRSTVSGLPSMDGYRR